LADICVRTLERDASRLNRASCSRFLIERRLSRKRVTLFRAMLQEGTLAAAKT
jgi:hypothetical protein